MLDTSLQYTFVKKYSNKRVYLKNIVVLKISVQMDLNVSFEFKNAWICKTVKHHDIVPEDIECEWSTLKILIWSCDALIQSLATDGPFFQVLVIEKYFHCSCSNMNVSIFLWKLEKKYSKSLFDFIPCIPSKHLLVFKTCLEDVFNTSSV